jgi:predicted ATP-grasp superfamily ATP-dependent carboligase
MKELKTVKDLERLLVPEAGVIKEDIEGTLTSVIMDEELDPLPLTFNNDCCVEINTSELTYITLSIENLEQLTVLALAAQNNYDNKYNQ